MENQASKHLGQKENYNLNAEYFLAEDEKGNLVAKTKEELLQMQKEGKTIPSVQGREVSSNGNNREDVEELTRTANIAKALGVSEDQILNVIQIKDRETKTAISDQDKENSEIYTVKLKQDSAGRGSHDWIAIEALPDRYLSRSSRRRKSIRAIK